MKGAGRWDALLSWREAGLDRPIVAEDLSVEALPREDVPARLDAMLTAFRGLRTDARESAVRSYHDVRHIYGVFYEKGGRTELLALRRAEDTARKAALTEVEKRRAEMPGVRWEDIPPSHPHGPNPDMFAWRRVDPGGMVDFVFVRKLVVEP